MLFNSFEFIFLFLPITWCGFYLAGYLRDSRHQILWLTCASLFFYAWWNWAYLFLLCGSITVNFFLGRAVAKDWRWRRAYLGAGIAANLAALFYFKYINFFLGSVDAAMGTSWNIEHVVLPLAISFFTFQQIAFLVDSYKGLSSEPRFSRYAMFVSFFPQLIAGPIVHHGTVLPQLERKRFVPSLDNLNVGLTIFAIGLFKKVVLADGIAPYANLVFDSSAEGLNPDFFVAWTGAICYSLQLYFDFSGYSDMAIGLARLFGIRLPLNFDSPYRAGSIAEIWRRWHITLSLFLRDYVYIPLGGNRVGVPRSYFNAFLTLFLGGIWHGANWTFVVWGAAHGLLVILNRIWAAARKRLGLSYLYLWDNITARVLTFLTWVATFVIFRADNLESAKTMLAGMLGMHGAYFPGHWLGFDSQIANFATKIGMQVGYPPIELQAKYLIMAMAFLLICWFAPSVRFFMAGHAPAVIHPDNERTPHQVDRWLSWKPNLFWAAIVSLLLVTALVNLSDINQFLYFQF